MHFIPFRYVCSHVLLKDLCLNYRLYASLVSWIMKCKLLKRFPSSRFRTVDWISRSESRELPAVSNPRWRLRAWRVSQSCSFIQFITTSVCFCLIESVRALSFIWAHIHTVLSFVSLNMIGRCIYSPGDSSGNRRRVWKLFFRLRKVL